MYAVTVMCIRDVCIVRFYVFIHVSMRICMYLCPYFVVCLKQCTGYCMCFRDISILKVYLFVFVLFLDKHV